MRSALRLRGRSKYGAQRTVVDGVACDSKREAQRWAVLKLLERAGEITELRHHVVFPLHAWCEATGGPVFVASYEADAVYVGRDGRRVVEDSKGVKTAIYTLKKRWMRVEYGTEILET